MKDRITPVGLKGNEINERMKALMGIQPINETKKTSVVELTKVGPDGNVYGIVRENHEYYIKTTTKKSKLSAEDFSYIGGLQNKKSEAYPSYAKAIKHLNLKFNSLNEAYGKSGQINVFEDDNLLNEMGYGFTGEGNLEGNKMSECCGAQMMEGMCMECGGMGMYEAELSDKQKDIAALAGDKNKIDADDLAALRAGKKKEDLDETQQAVQDMMEEDEMTDKEKKFAALADPKDKITYADKIAGAKKKGKLSIETAMSEMDSIIESIMPTNKKKVYTIK